MFKKITALAVLAVLCLNFAVLAQQRITITGTIVNVDGQPIAGANISTKDKTVSTQSDSNGNFRLANVTIGSSIVVTSIGYVTKEIIADKATLGNIILETSQQSLQEVEINAGYYSVEKRKLTGNISSIKAADIEKQPVSNPLQAMQGRMAGVYISQANGTPGSAINLQIRGRNSIEASNNPLYIVDGVPFNSQPLTNSLSVSIAVHTSQGASPFNTISPDDIESIEVLKDADATAIYGSRGANGVVLITTKKGSAGQSRISVSGYSGFSQVTRKLQMLNTEEYLAMRRAAFANDNLTPGATQYDVNGTWNQDRYTDWQEELIGGLAKFNNANISLSGGNALNSYMVSGSFNDQGSVYQGHLGYQRANVHFSAAHSSANKKLNLSFSASYANDRSNWINADFTTWAIRLAPNAPSLYTESGVLNWENSTWINPLRELETDYKSTNRVLTANTTVSYKLWRTLEFKTSLGYQSHALDDISLNPASYYDPAEGRTPSTSFSDFNKTTLYSWIAEPQLSYGHHGKLGQLKVLLGISLQKQQREQTLIRASGFVSDDLLENVQGGSSTSIRGYSYIPYAYSGAYARINYELMDKFIVNLTARRDGSSRFGADRKFANFGAIGAAYIFSNEDWIKNNLPFVSFGKIRGSYGITGNDQIGDFEYLNTYQASAGYNGVSGLAPARLYNPDFGWETNRKLEMGIELGFLNNRINSNISYYINRSSNQLVSYPLALSTGFNAIRSNLGAVVQNSGLEAEIYANVLRTKRLNWKTSINFTVPRNKLVSFPGLENSSYADSYAIGYPLNISKVLNLLGVDPTTGVYVYEDANGDGSVTYDRDRKTIMKKGQQWYGGIENTLRYGQWELGVLFQFVKQRSLQFTPLSMPGVANNNQPLAYQNLYWSKQGDAAAFQRLSSGGNNAANMAFSNYEYSTAAIGDASFVRLKNLHFSYSFKRAGQKSLRLYFQGQNLLTITNYFGLDPETANTSLPPLQTFTFGFQLGL